MSDVAKISDEMQTINCNGEMRVEIMHKITIQILTLRFADLERPALVSRSLQKLDRCTVITETTV